MGFKQLDITPSASPSPTTPSGKETLQKVFSVTRTETAAATKAVLPSQSSVLKVLYHGTTASDATTSASIAINLIQSGVTFSTGTVDVKTSGTVTALVQMTNLPNVQAIPPAGDILVSATKTTSGTETTGGPFKFSIEYVA